SYVDPRIQKRDTQRNWSMVAATGTGVGQVSRNVSSLAVDTAGNLYAADVGSDRIQKRDVQGHWSVVATRGTAPGQVVEPSAAAVDGAGNLYVAETSWPSTYHRIEKRD